VFVGGAGVKNEYGNSAAAQAIAKQAVDKGKVLGAICIAPVILANATIQISDGIGALVYVF
jgi:protease I